MRKPLLFVASCALLISVIPSTSYAQWEDGAYTAMRANEGERSCLSRIGPAGLVRLVVFVEARPRDTLSGAYANREDVHANPAVVELEDAFASAVAEAMKGLLGTTGDSIPVADHVLQWRSLSARANVTLWRTGPPTIVTTRGDQELAADSAGSRLLAEAIRVAQSKGLPGALPATFAGDSAQFRLDFISPTVDSSGSAHSIEARRAFPAFSIMQPWFAQVRQLQRPRVTYPEALRVQGYMATVTLLAVIDTLGVALPGSVHVLPPEGTHFTRSQQAIYDEFAERAAEAMQRSPYASASVGGCRVFSRIAQRFAYTIQ